MGGTGQRRLGHCDRVVRRLSASHAGAKTIQWQPNRVSRCVEREEDVQSSGVRVSTMPRMGCKWEGRHGKELDSQRRARDLARSSREPRSWTCCMCRLGS